MWQKVEDVKVKQIWTCQNKECKNKITISISPNEYNKLGIPMCWCGKKLVYIETRADV